jgi:hypothetical protein
MNPSFSKAFQTHQEHDLKHPGLVDLITTKQNKLPSFIDRLIPEDISKRTYHITLLSIPKLQKHSHRNFQISSLGI